MYMTTFNMTKQECLEHKSAVKKATDDATTPWTEKRHTKTTFWHRSTAEIEKHQNPHQLSGECATFVFFFRAVAAA